MGCTCEPWSEQCRGKIWQLESLKKAVTTLHSEATRSTRQNNNLQFQEGPAGLVVQYLEEVPMAYAQAGDFLAVTSGPWSDLLRVLLPAYRIPQAKCCRPCPEAFRIPRAAMRTFWVGPKHADFCEACWTLTPGEKNDFRRSPRFLAQLDYRPALGYAVPGNQPIPQAFYNPRPRHTISPGRISLHCDPRPRKPQACLYTRCFSL